MFRKLITIAALGTVAATAFATTTGDVQRTIALKDGATVHVFKDGKMAMEDTLGRVVRMKPGHVMETRDGQKIIMVGDEVARLDTVLRITRNSSQ